ncbi:MAG: 50S ribosomal protein L17 [Thermoguttaceae bacterium]|nr:50S ribosomal protein L17 [Thermoguttaceae bacterium]
MKHRRIGRTLGRNPNHQRALLKNLASALILTERAKEDYDEESMAAKTPGRIITTQTKAKELRPYIEKCVTIAVKAQKSIEEAASLACTAKRVSDEWRAWRQGEGWKKWEKAAAPALAARRRALSMLGSREAVLLLFNVIAPRFVGRPGGYTRIMTLAKPRLGDAGKRAIIEFVGKNDRPKRKAIVPTVE